VKELWGIGNASKNSFRMHSLKLRERMVEKSRWRQFFFGFYATLTGVDCCNTSSIPKSAESVEVIFTFILENKMHI